MSQPPTAPAPGPSILIELALVFLRLGVTSFGGPAAHIALMELEFVRRRRWLTESDFLDLLGAVHLIPGPNSTELALHIGLKRAGWRGLIVAGVCFITPALAVIAVLAWAYVRYRELGVAEAILWGVKPIALALVVQALVRLGRTLLRSPGPISVAAGSLLALAAGVHELVVMLAAGLALAIGRARIRPTPTPTLSLLAIIPLFPARAPSLTTLFLVFLKIGGLLYGSGYVLFAFIRADLVERLGWISEAQLLDAVAIGQLAPGPLFSTAALIGYMVRGLPGAVVATLGIFLPSFVFVALSGPLVPRIRRSAAASSFLDGVNAASLALVAAVAVTLARAALVDSTTLTLAAASLATLVLTRVPPVWLIALGAAVGLMAGAS